MRDAASWWMPHPYRLPSGEERRQAWDLAKNAARSAAFSSSGIARRIACTSKITSSEVYS